MHPTAPPDAQAPRWSGASRVRGQLCIHRIPGELQAPQGLPDPGTVEVWYAPVGGTSGESPFRTHPTSPQDLERVRRFRDEAARTRFLSARRALRSLLAAYLSMHPGKWALSTDRRGKPRLETALEGDPPISFNVAHSGEWIALAFRTGGAVGIDLEVEGGLPDLDALARYTLSPKEMEGFSGLPPELRNPIFFQAWTRKEAFLKALGVGLSVPPGHVTAGLGPEPTVLRRSVDPEGEESGAGRWAVASIPGPPGYAAAVSFQERAVRIRVMEGPRGWLVDPRPTPGD